MRLIYSSQFKRDFKRIKSRGKNTSQLKIVIEKLLKNEKLDVKHRDHKLVGKWKNFRDCHIEPDWILIYRIKDFALFLERTGSHSDLFK